jgi:hypothetical protein
MPIASFSGFGHLAGSATGASAELTLLYPAIPSTGQPKDTNQPARTMASKANLKTSGREAALARRRAMSNKGKQGVSTTAPERTRAGDRRPAPVAAAPRQTQLPVSAPAPAATPAVPGPIARRRATPVRSPSQSSRALARQRRAEMAQAGRRALRSTDRVRSAADGVVSTKAQASTPTGEKKGCGCGCNGDRKAAFSPSSTPAVKLSAKPSGLGNGKVALRNKRADAALGAKPTSRMVSLARRAALSSRGKGANNAHSSPASLARQANPRLSGRELAQKVRAQRSTNGGAGERKSPPSGRMRPAAQRQGASDQPWKVGVSETALGQSVTGTRVGRSRKTTGDEPSTCRNVTGTEYLGADIFREFCQTEPAPGVAKVRVSPTGHGNRVSGTEVGRSAKVTGDEPGTCKNVTGTEYLSPEQYAAYCETRPAPGPAKVSVAQTRQGRPVSGNLVGRSASVTGDEAGADVRPTGTQYTAPSDIGRELLPPKVGQSKTLSGGTVTGTRVGRSPRVTGDEPGSCRVVTGDEYVDLSQYQACNVEAAPEPPKVGRSATFKGKFVSGTQTGRSSKVTGDEPGTCKAVTGTPYAGLEQAAEYCEAPQQQQIQARTRQLAATPGPRMTGIQPGIGGVMTGAARGACERPTGTPYVGADQFAEACGDGNGAAPGDADFPRLLEGGVPGGQFSVTSPARQAFAAASARSQGVTGTAYESSRHITGPFGMGSGKITGTEQSRFDRAPVVPDLTRMAPEAESAVGDGEAQESGAAPAPRITGEGQSAGSKITGDDWERGNRVTGTEGTSARRRNPTRPGPMSAMPPIEVKRNEDKPLPVSQVTGSTGSTERGALITYSGGARG